MRVPGRTRLILDAIEQGKTASQIMAAFSIGRPYVHALAWRHELAVAKEKKVSQSMLVSVTCRKDHHGARACLHSVSIPESILRGAGLDKASRLRVTAEPGRIVITIEPQPKGT